ncbi:MAG: DUF433 domain-containing protein [Pyrinomonadaceae bacterium]
MLNTHAQGAGTTVGADRPSDLAAALTEYDNSLVLRVSVGCYNQGENQGERTTMRNPSKARLMGRYVVTDPNVCHGKPTFRGTRVMVSDVLDQVAAGMAWESIIEEWNDSITKEAIQEAVNLASQALLKHVDELVLEPVEA